MFLSLLKVKGHSMEPMMKNGSFFMASSIPFWFAEPKKGDVILFGAEGKNIVKKIVKIQNRKYFIEGENRLDSKRFAPIGKKDIVGKIIFKF